MLGQGSVSIQDLFKPMKKYLIYASFALALCCVLAAGAKATPTGFTSISLCAFPTGCFSGVYYPHPFIAGSSSTIYFSGTPGPTGEYANLAIAIPYADNSANWASGDLFDSLNLQPPAEYYFYPPGYHPFDFSVAQSKSSLVLGYAPGSYATVDLFYYNWGTNPTALTPQAIKVKNLPVGSLILGFTTRGSAFDSPISVTPWGASLLVTPAPTPEPASILSFGTGLLGMALVLRKSLLA